MMRVHIPFKQILDYVRLLHLLQEVTFFAPATHDSSVFPLRASRGSRNGARHLGLKKGVSGLDHLFLANTNTNTLRCHQTQKIWIIWCDFSSQKAPLRLDFPAMFDSQRATIAGQSGQSTSRGCQSVVQRFIAWKHHGFGKTPKHDPKWLYQAIQIHNWGLF